MSFKSGEIVEGIVSGITNFGAFIKLPDNRTGLCHISEIADDYVKNVKDYLEEGQEVKVKVLKIKENDKIELSVKQAKEKPKEQKHSSNNNHKNYNRDNRPPKKESFENMLSNFMKNSDEKLRGIKQRDQRY